MGDVTSNVSVKQLCKLFSNEAEVSTVHRRTSDKPGNKKPRHWDVKSQNDSKLVRFEDDNKSSTLPRQAKAPRLTELHVDTTHRALSPAPEATLKRYNSFNARLLLSPNHSLTERMTINPIFSMKRYSLFGANVTPDWEYYTDIPGVEVIPSTTPTWKVPILQQRNCQHVLSYLRWREDERKRRELERIEQERRSCVPQWMKDMKLQRRRRQLQHQLMKETAEDIEHKETWQKDVWRESSRRMDTMTLYN